MNKYNKIHVYLRACDQNKPNNSRPSWFSIDKCFINLLKTANWDLVDLTIVYDGNYENSIVKDFELFYPYRVKIIDSKSYAGEVYEKNCGSSKSGALTAQIIKNDNLPENSIIYILENDYLHTPGWAEATLDFFNTTWDSENCMISLYNHPDKMYFTLSEKTISENGLEKHWGMYRDLKSQIFFTNYCHWRTVPSICSSWIFTKKTFEDAYGLLNIGISDNTCCAEMTKRGKWFASPIPGISTHCQEPFVSPFINWEKLSNL